MQCYVLLAHCDLKQASQQLFLLFLLLSVHALYYKGYVCVSMVSCNRSRMAGICLHCMRYSFVQLEYSYIPRAVFRGESVKEATVMHAVCVESQIWLWVRHSGYSVLWYTVNTYMISDYIHPENAIYASVVYLQGRCL